MAALGGYAAVVALLALGDVSPVFQIAAGISVALYACTLHGAVLGRLVFLPLSRATGQQALVSTI